MTSGLVERHIAFLEALRGAGLSVSLAEGLDAVAALSALPWDQRETVHAAYAATLLKKQSQRPTFDALFDVYFPRLVGEGAGREETDEAVRDNGQALAEFLSRHSRVRAVHYAGLPGHPQHEIARRQMRGFGGVVSFGSLARADEICVD